MTAAFKLRAKLVTRLLPYSVSDGRITLPIRTRSEANMREHWAGKAKRAKAQRAAAFQLARVELRAFIGKPVCIKLVRVAPCALDDDNLRGALKAVRDGLADALEVNDRSPLVAWEYGQERGETRTYGVRVELSHGKT